MQAFVKLIKRGTMRVTSKFYNEGRKMLKLLILCHSYKI